MRLGNVARNWLYPFGFVGAVAAMWIYAAAVAESGRADAASKILQSTSCREMLTGYDVPPDEPVVLNHGD